MNKSSRFVVAVQVLTGLAIGEKFGILKCVNSSRLAESVDTNPVVIRRLLGKLKNAGLVISTQGVEGGSTLARRPEDISLLDIYRAVESGDLVNYRHSTPNMACPVGCNIIPVLEGVLMEAQGAFEAVLQSVMLSAVRDDIIKRSNDEFTSVAEYLQDEQCKKK